MAYNGTLNDYRKVCNSCVIYVLLFVIGFLIIGISSSFIFCHWCFKSDTSSTNINPCTGTLIYETNKWEISNKLILKIVHITFLMIWLILKTLIQVY